MINGKEFTHFPSTFPTPPFMRLGGSNISNMGIISSQT